MNCLCGMIKESKRYISYITGGLIVSIAWIAVLIKYRHGWSNRLRQVEEKKYYFQRYYEFLLRWEEDQNGGKVAEKLHEKGYSKVAVYGMGKVGWFLCNALMDAGIDVAYAIDKDADNLSYNAFSNIPDVRLKLPEEDLEPVDVIIVTALVSYHEIKATLKKKYSYTIMSIEELVE